MPQRLRDLFEEQGVSPAEAAAQERDCALFFMALSRLFTDDVPKQETQDDEAA